MTIGKRKASIPFDSPTQARCIGSKKCAEGVSFCPKHHSHAYPLVEAAHRDEVAA